MLIVDAHEDIAWNVLTFGRDYRRSARWIRQQEAHTPFPSYNGNTLLGKDEWLAGHIGIIFATLYTSPAWHRLGEWDTQYYQDVHEAYDRAGAQLDVYHRLAEEEEQFQVVGTKGELAEVVETWTDDQIPLEERRIGLVPLMEGADPLVEPEQVEEWFERGVRIIGPAWKRTRYAGGTGEPGPLTAAGFRLLEVMADLNLILDLSHLAEKAYFQALEWYDGVLIASHSNPRRFLPSDRGLSDEMITALAERGGVVGIVPYNSFLKPGWRGSGRKEDVSLSDVVDAIDHVCQTTGSVAHVGIGSDFDGGLGREHVPAEVDTVADLQRLTWPLEERGYTPDQIDNIFSGNWLRVLQETLPD